MKSAPPLLPPSTIDMLDDIDANDDDLESIFLSVHLSHETELRRLLLKNPSLVNQPDSRTGDSPIHLAIRQCNYEIVRILIEFDARIGRRNYEGLTPLGVARMMNPTCVSTGAGAGNGSGALEQVNIDNNISMGELLSSHYTLDRTIPPGEEPERYTYQRTNLSSIPSEATLREIARQERLAIKLQQWRHWKQHESASIIQRMVQRYLKKLKQIRLELEHRSATR